MRRFAFLALTLRETALAVSMLALLLTCAGCATGSPGGIDRDTAYDFNIG